MRPLDLLATVIYPALFFLYGIFALISFGHVIQFSKWERIVMYSCYAIIAAGLAVTNGYLDVGARTIAKPVVRFAFSVVLVILSLHVPEIIRILRHWGGNSDS
jgi:hypothetical protein